MIELHTPSKSSLGEETKLGDDQLIELFGVSYDGQLGENFETPLLGN